MLKFLEMFLLFTWVGQLERERGSLMLVFITPPCSPRITPKLGSREGSSEGQSLPCCRRAERHHPPGVDPG